MVKEIMACAHHVPHNVMFMWVLYERFHVKGGPEDIALLKWDEGDILA